jgi:quercetin dioxygenase-like cupin family protein
MRVKRAADMPAVKGPAKWFTGEVRISTPFQAEEPGRAGGATVTFEPGSRTAWHTHPLGQSLVVTSGIGWTQCDGEEIVEIRAGDVIWCPPGHKHWHGATPTSSMTHVAIAEMLDGRAVDWMEHVTDEEYLKGTNNAEA